MGPRPQPNPVRGLLRGAFVALALIAVIVAVLLALQSIYAPPAKAPSAPPTVPPTPSAHATPHLLPTPHAAATPGKTKSLGAIVRRPAVTLAEQGAASVFAQTNKRKAAWPANATTSHSRHLIAWFQAGDAYHSRLLLTVRASGVTRFAAYGNPLIRPVWSPNDRELLFVQVTATKAFPGARWSLVQLDTATLHTTTLAQVDAMSLVPLGWSSGRVLYLVGTAADTSVFTHTSRGNHYLSIVLPQPVVSSLLSPDGRFLATVSPTNCHNSCRLIVFDLLKLATWYGPSGISGETDLAWLPDSRRLLTVQHGRLASVDVIGHTLRSFATPFTFPVVWSQPMRATQSPAAIRLEDSVDGTIYVVRQ